MRNDLEHFDQFRTQIHRRKTTLVKEGPWLLGLRRCAAVQSQQKFNEAGMASTVAFQRLQSNNGQYGARWESWSRRVAPRRGLLNNLFVERLTKYASRCLHEKRLAPGNVSAGSC